MGPSAAGDPEPGLFALQETPSPSHIFILGQLGGELRALNSNIERIRRDHAEDVSSLSTRVGALERSDAKRTGQVSIISVLIAAGVSVVVAVTSGFFRQG